MRIRVGRCQAVPNLERLVSCLCAFADMSARVVSVLPSKVKRPEVATRLGGISGPHLTGHHCTVISRLNVDIPSFNSVVSFLYRYYQSEGVVKRLALWVGEERRGEPCDWGAMRRRSGSEEVAAPHIFHEPLSSKLTCPFSGTSGSNSCTMQL